MYMILQMGINQIGVRKKIIDGIHAVHKKEWESSSLPTVHYNKQLRYAIISLSLTQLQKYLRDAFNLRNEKIQNAITT